MSKSCLTVSTSIMPPAIFQYSAICNGYFATTPKSTDEVSDIMKVAWANNVFVAPRGSGSGLCAGALAKQGGVVICFTMINRIIEINTANRYAVVEPGVVIADLQKAADRVGLFYPPDPGSAAVASMGGA